MDNRPRGREQHVTGQGKPVYKRGEGLGTGPVGNGGGYSGRGGSGGSGGPKRSGGGSKLIYLIIALVVIIGGGGGALGGLFSDSDTGSNYTPSNQTTYTQNTTTSSSNTSGSGMDISSLFSMPSGFSASNTSSGWKLSSNNGQLNSAVDSAAREKFTKIKGNGKDTYTLMVYLCGADLESKSGMATSDLTEMAKANLSDQVNVIVYTGGAKKWNNSVVSNKTNQIYKVENGGLVRLESDMGNVTMTKPSTLAEFIKYCKKNYPADRSSLILWDHGGGSISGYGYDEAHASSGSMSLKGIREALKEGGMTFDFIGFDACLMATVENALMLSDYADYLIASEETEPGVGWYYTNWLTKLSKDTSMSTLEIGKNIADDFVSVCQQKCQGQKTTLSVVDLAELAETVPADFSAFAKSTLELVENDQYKVVSDARSHAKEFAQSNKLDQVDLVSLAYHMGTDEAKQLIDTLLSAVKYNRTGSNMTDAYGLSIYFPYNKVSKVQNAVSAYDAIGMDSSYTACIQKFASLETGGQAISGGSTSPLDTLLGGYVQSGSTGSQSASGSVQSADVIAQLLTSLLGGDSAGISGLGGGNMGFLGKSIDVEADTQYLAANQFDPGQLVWVQNAEGDSVITLTEDQWSLVHDLELNVFVDDGAGYIDLGLDNVYDFDGEGNLKDCFKGTWLAINDQPVPYYHTETVDDGDSYTITGYVPAYVNDVRSKLILVFDDENPYGYVAGIQTVYEESETEVVAKDLDQLEDGDTIDFICDYYTYDGDYEDSYLMGDQLVVDGELVISDVILTGQKLSACYRLTDIYNQHYWTPVMEK